jgi:hypothetical protein
MSDMITNETINNLIVSGFTPLNSVGSLLDEDTGQIYPQLEDGSPDWDNALSLYEDEVSDEWVISLSKEDAQKCYPYLEGNNTTNPNHEKYFLNPNI